MTGPDGVVGGTLAFRTAHALLSADRRVPFEEVYALCYLVLERDGGPVSATSGQSPLDRKVITRLRKRGWVSAAGEGTVRYAARVSSVASYGRGRARAGGEWTISVRPVIAGEKLTRAVVASHEGAELVLQHVRGVEEMEARDASDLDVVGSTARTPAVAAVEASELVADELERGDIAPVARSGRSPDLGPSLGLGWGEVRRRREAAGDDDDEQDGGDVERRDWSVELGDLKETAGRLFRTWYLGSELDWAGYAFAALRRAGLGDVSGHGSGVVDLIALAIISREFAARGMREGLPGEGPLAVETVDLVGEYPLVSPVEVGRLAEGRKVVVTRDFADGDDPEELLRELAICAVPRVAQALLDDWGALEVLLSLASAAEDEAVYPTSARPGHWPEPEVPDAERAYTWIVDGMRLNA